MLVIYSECGVFSRCLSPGFDFRVLLVQMPTRSKESNLPCYIAEYKVEKRKSSILRSQGWIIPYSYVFLSLQGCLPLPRKLLPKNVVEPATLWILQFEYRGNWGWSKSILSILSYFVTLKNTFSYSFKSVSKFVSHINIIRKSSVFFFVCFSLSLVN